MQVFEIIHRKEFMAQLLKSDLFDTFEVREIVAHVAFKMVLDGKRNTEYFHDSLEDSDAITMSQSTYLTWKEMRKYVYELMTGKHLPTYFKFILSTNQDKTAQLSTEATTFYLNITFKDNQITCTTGTAYKNFTLDKSCETLWDERMQHFLLKYDFI